jgi:hypothetical protein
MFTTAFKAVVVATAVATAASANWKATLDPIGGSGVSGKATVAAPRAAGVGTDNDKARLHANVRIKGAHAGDTHPWHVHSGTCGDANAPVLGSANDYSPITVTGAGEGHAVAHLDVTLSPGGTYLVNVHRSATDLTVIACGALKETAAEDR